MSKPISPPNPDLVYKLYTGVFTVQFTRMALLLDVFTPLVDGPKTAVSIARSCTCDPTNMGALLDFLCSQQILDKQADAYALTPTAATFLVRGRPTYTGDWILAMTDPTLWQRALTAIRNGEPTHASPPWAQEMAD